MFFKNLVENCDCVEANEISISVLYDACNIQYVFEYFRESLTVRMDVN